MAKPLDPDTLISQ